MTQVVLTGSTGCRGRLSPSLWGGHIGWKRLCIPPLATTNLGVSDRVLPRIAPGRSLNPEMAKSPVVAFPLFYTTYRFTTRQAKQSAS